MSRCPIALLLLPILALGAAEDGGDPLRELMRLLAGTAEDPAEEFAAAADATDPLRRRYAALLLLRDDLDARLAVTRAAIRAQPAVRAALDAALDAATAFHAALAATPALAELTAQIDAQAAALAAAAVPADLASWRERGATFLAEQARGHAALSALEARREALITEDLRLRELREDRAIALERCLDLYRAALAADPDHARLVTQRDLIESLLREARRRAATPPGHR
jgi:hypothetical protein